MLDDVDSGVKILVIILVVGVARRLRSHVFSALDGHVTATTTSMTADRDGIAE